MISTHRESSKPFALAGAGATTGGGATITGVRLESGQQLACDAVVLAVNPDALPALTGLTSTLGLHQISFITVRGPVCPIHTPWRRLKCSAPCLRGTFIGVYNRRCAYGEFASAWLTGLYLRS